MEIQEGKRYYNTRLRHWITIKRLYNIPNPTYVYYIDENGRVRVQEKKELTLPQNTPKNCI